jgi:hypothetical protein
MDSANQLPPGNYMKINNVIFFFTEILPLAEIRRDIMAKCPICVGQRADYFNTLDLQRVMSRGIFQELECQVITHMII